jgi:hypothetical protein
MADIEIKDKASLEAWLKTRPRRDAEIIAFRAAARVFPLWGREMEEEWPLNLVDADSSMDIRHFRSILASQCVCLASQKNLMMALAGKMISFVMSMQLQVLQKLRKLPVKRLSENFHNAFPIF